MITALNFCQEILYIIEKDKLCYNSLFSNIISIFYLNNAGILRIDYCPYYNAKIKKKLAIIKRSCNKLEKSIKLDNLCKKIYNYSLSLLGKILEIRNVPFYRNDGSIINTYDFKITFDVIGEIDFVKRVAPKKYIIKFRNKLNTKFLNVLLNNKIMEGSLIKAKLLNN